MPDMNWLRLSGRPPQQDARMSRPVALTTRPLEFRTRADACHILTHCPGFDGPAAFLHLLEIGTMKRSLKRRVKRWLMRELDRSFLKISDAQKPQNASLDGRRAEFSSDKWTRDGYGLR